MHTQVWGFRKGGRERRKSILGTYQGSGETWVLQGMGAQNPPGVEGGSKAKTMTLSLASLWDPSVRDWHGPARTPSPVFQ